MWRLKRPTMVGAAQLWALQHGSLAGRAGVSVILLNSVVLETEHCKHWSPLRHAVEVLGAHSQQVQVLLLTPRMQHKRCFRRSPKRCPAG